MSRESFGDVSSYLDGVPVKVSERYRPPRKVVLPVGFLHRLDVTLENAITDTHYDFSLCRRVIESTDAEQARREAELEARNSRIAAEEEKRKAVQEKELVEKIDTFKIQDEVQAVAKTEETVPAVAAPPVSTLTSATKSDFSEILTPLPMPAPTKLTSPVIPAFNISDFEPDTSSPFDNMELKTINDMEELAFVLQSKSTLEDSKPKDSNQYSNAYYQPTTNHVSPSVASRKPANNAYGAYNHTPPSCESLTTNSSAQQWYNSYHPPQANSTSYAYPYAQNSWMYPASQNSVLTQYATHSAPVEYGAQSRGYAVSSTASSLYGSRAAANTITHSSHSNLADQSHLQGRSSKSVPDIMEELQQEFNAIKKTIAMPVPKAESPALTKLSPPRPASFGSTGLEDWKPWPELDSPLSMEHQSELAASKVHVSQPSDPLAKLPDEARKMARQMCEMGFPLSRVAKACILLEADQKKVLDFLVQVQALEERGFPGSQVELVLGTLALDEAQALKFLPLLGQLVDLGFPEENSARALLSADYDRDKAIDALLSS